MSGAEKRDFARRLRHLIDQKGIIQSDLARAVWGETTTRDGYRVAKNRDRISVYLRAKVLPSRQVLQRLATALGVQTNDLAPGFDDENGDPGFSMRELEPGRVHLRIDRVVSAQVAAEIAALLLGGAH